MQLNNTAILIILYVSLPILIISCSKDWLEAKPDKALTIPTKIEDYEAILNNSFDATGVNVNTPALGEISSGDFFVDYANWQTGDPFLRNAYIWKGGNSFYEGDNNIGDWIAPYQSILNTNIVIDGIQNLSLTTEADQIKANNVKGMAHFIRAFKHYAISQIFCMPYKPNSAKTDLGIPMRLSSDFNIPSKRFTISDTYSQIISDLKLAGTLLQQENPTGKIEKVRPSKTAALAMLSRVYLSMGEYDSALHYSTKCLEKYPTLIDYNDPNQVTTGNVFPFHQFNPEVIYHSEMALYIYLVQQILKVDSTLIKLYNTDDLRLQAYYIPNGDYYDYRGSYTSNYPCFDGLATDEIYLIRAESSARKGLSQQAADNLNSLLQNRYITGTYVPIDANDPDLLKKILLERRKELCFRGLRWSDLRRLNLSDEKETLKRTLNGTEYTLPPNDIRYVFPFPENVIALTGMEQNPR